MRKNIAAALVAVIAVTLGGCSKDSPTSPSMPTPPAAVQASLRVEYTGAVSGTDSVGIRFTENGLSVSEVMTKTGPNTWVWEAGPDVLQKLQETGDVNAIISDGNLPSGHIWPGYPIRVSTVRGEQVVSSQVSTASDVWSDQPNSVTIIYYSRFRMMRDDTVMLIPGPGIPSTP